jgi:Ca2+-binding RTX toxin-like protein
MLDPDEDVSANTAGVDANAGVVLVGNGSADMLIGGDGDDILIGDLNNDQLEGGLGSDTFVWNSGESGTDVIIDFQAGIDKLDLSALLDGDFTDAGSLDGYLTFSLGATTITADNDGVAGGDVQVIELAGVDLANFYGPGADAATVIAGMLGDGTLKVDAA